MKGYKLSTSTIVAIIFLIISGIAMLFMLNFSAKTKKAKTNNFNEVTTEEITTTNVTDTTTNQNPDDNNNQGDPEEKIVTTNFNDSLYGILQYYDLNGNYNLEFNYSGAKFNFKCSKFDEGTNKCSEGSAMMNTGETILPLYTYDKDEDNYDNHRKDFHINYNDNNIIITSNYAGKKPGTIKIYEKNGNIKTTIENVITGYIENDELDDEYYPYYNSETNEISYYYCSNNEVYGRTVSIDDINTTLYEEKIEGARCN